MTDEERGPKRRIFRSLHYDCNAQRCRGIQRQEFSIGIGTENEDPEIRIDRQLANSHDRIWTIGELVAAALEPSDVPPLPRPTPTNTLKPGYRPFRPIVIRGDKMSKPRYDRACFASILCS